MSFKSVIDEIGIAALSSLLGVPDSHVRTMKARDSIPPRYWSQIAEEGRRRGSDAMTFEALSLMHAERYALGRKVEASE